MNKLLHLIPVAAALACVFADEPAHAVAICTVSSSGISFGTYDSLSSQPLETSGTVTVICRGTNAGDAVNYDIALGTGGSGNFDHRRMSSGVSTLTYNLYTTPARNSIWGDGTGQTKTIHGGHGVGQSTVTRNYTVYARVPGRQNIQAGAYIDSVVVTVIY